MRSPSRSASARRLSTTVANPSLIAIPSALASNGPAASGRRERVRLGEAQVRERVLDRVDAAREHHVAGADLQLPGAEADRAQRRGAGRVDGVVGAAEVEPVGDAAGGDVHQQPGEAVLGPLGQPLEQLLLQLRVGVPEQRRQRRANRVADRRVGAAAAGAEDHRGALAVERPRRVAGVARAPPARTAAPAAGTARSSASDFGGSPSAIGSSATGSMKPPQRE